MKFQSIRTDDQYPGGYNHDYVADLVSNDPRTPRQIARDAGISHTKLYAAMDGDLKKIETLGRLADTFNVDISEFFKFNRRKKSARSRVRRAVLNGGSRSGR